jgi:hypothetical protein
MCQLSSTASIGEAMTYAALQYRHIYGSARQESEERAMRQRYGIETAQKLAATITAVRERAVASEHYLHLARSGWLPRPEQPSTNN